MVIDLGSTAESIAWHVGQMLRPANGHTDRIPDIRSARCQRGEVWFGRDG
ncbi:MAG TPA: hypothetical protein VF469_29910 [Kofleriaceae bacterium]